jgi:hypothetical protein
VPVEKIGLGRGGVGSQAIEAGRTQMKFTIAIEPGWQAEGIQGMGVGYR